VNIRPASFADVASLIELDRTCSMAAHWTEKQYQQALCLQSDDPHRLAMVADEVHLAPSDANLKATSQIFGFLVARYLAPEWELENIIVAPTARRIGLGMRLIQVLLAKARETNSEAVFLEARESNAAARSLYETAGFELTGRRKAYYTNPSEGAVLYRLRLA
jgi:[ribosomal protein S18]-alanine N-acetyltransferase